MNYLEKFKAGKIAVNAKTEEEYDSVYNYLKENYFTYTKVNSFISHNFKDNLKKGILFLDICGEIYLDRDFIVNKIISAAEFLVESEEEKINPEDITFFQDKDFRVKMETLEEKKLRLERELKEVIEELENPKFNEPCENSMIIEVDMPLNSKDIEQRAKEIKVYNLLKNFSDANDKVGLDGEDFLDFIFFDETLKEEARRRYRKELEELV